MCEHSDQKIDLALMDPVLEQYQDQKGALIPVLQKAQGVYGWLPQEVLDLISKRMALPLSKVYGVATFYSQFYMERRGRHVLKICDGTACHVKGAPALLNAVQDEFGIAPGETTEDYELTVDVVYCLGSCALAPVAVLDDKVIGNLRRDTLSHEVNKRVQSEPEPVED